MTSVIPGGDRGRSRRLLDEAAIYLKPAVTYAEPVGLAEIADRLCVARQTAKTWNARKLLPEPKWTVSGAPAWEWEDIEEWAKRTGRMK